MTSIETSAQEVILLRSSDGGNTFNPVNTLTLTGASPTTVAIQDPGPVTPDGTYEYEVEQVDVAGNTSLPSAPLSVTFITGPQPNPPALVLDPSSDSGVKGDHITNVTNPKFDVSNIDLDFPFPSDGPVEVFLLRSTSPNGGFTQVATATGTSATLVLQDPGPVAGNPPVAGITYYYEVRQEDVAGNVSAPSAVIPLTIKTAARPRPGWRSTRTTPSPGGSDTGLSNSDDITSDDQPFFTVSSIETNAQQVILLRSSDGGATFAPVSSLTSPRRPRAPSPSRTPVPSSPTAPLSTKSSKSTSRTTSACPATRSRS